MQQAPTEQVENLVKMSWTPQRTKSSKSTIPDFFEKEKNMRVLIPILLFAFLAPVAHAQGHGMFIFPNDGQDQDQQDMDEFQCLRIARDQTGFDPMATPRATTAAPQQQGGAVGGAARGALLGTAIGAATGNTRQGLRAGAVGGGLMGGMRRADSNAQRDQWAQQESANYQRNRNNWTRAFTGCMESRGFTVR